MQGGGEVQAGPSWTATLRHPRLWCAWGTSAFCCFCPIVRAAMRKKLQPFARWRPAYPVSSQP
eukprot:1204786-Prymnesium_polylepis.1